MLLRGIQGLRPGSGWQEGPGVSWLGWRLSERDFPADAMSDSVDTWREEQVLTSDPQPSGTFPFFFFPSIEKSFIVSC